MLAPRVRAPDELLERGLAPLVAVRRAEVGIDGDGEEAAAREAVSHAPLDVARLAQDTNGRKIETSKLTFQVRRVL